MEYIYKEFNGHTTVIDKEDEWVFDGTYHWYAIKSCQGTFYIQGYKFNGKNNYERVSLARLIVGNPKWMTVDHKNHDTLDNRKENLRICTNSQNNWNQRKSNTKLKYKGIHFDPRTRNFPYQARIRFNNKLLTLGSFKTDIEAAIAYDKKAIELFGEFAFINFPNGIEP